MYYCKTCGSITEGEDASERLCEDPNGRYYYQVCDRCGSDDLTDADKCIVCGEYVESTIGDVCDDCREKIFELYWQMFNTIKENDEKADNGNIIEGMASVFDDFYNKYRWKE